MVYIRCFLEVAGSLPMVVRQRSFFPWEAQCILADVRSCSRADTLIVAAPGPPSSALEHC